jgi:hypothetical protein
MRRPVCGLCLRTGNSCTFPSRRKKPVQRKPHLKARYQDITNNLSKLVDALTAASKKSEEAEDPESQYEASQTLLRDSLKGILNEINGTDQPQPKNPQADDVRSRSVRNNSSLLLEHANADEVAPDTRHSLDELRASDALAASDSRPPDGDIISGALAAELSDLFFEKVQPWLPLLHHPNFLRTYSTAFASQGDVLKDLAIDQCLLLCSMWSLSARFSENPRFANTPPTKRGHVFAQRARGYYTRARYLRKPSLTYLQGCIVLSNYFYTSGPTHQGWILIGVCVRLAYDLGLSEIDEEDITRPLTDSFDKEELRRAWWGVWELDRFASIVSRNPFSIDRQRMTVALPISDEAWFSGQDITSAQLSTINGQSWMSLQNCDNQDARAWFLVANNLFATIHDRLQQKPELSPDEILALANEIGCFRLALPTALHLDAHELVFGPTTYKKCNWTIGIHLMLMSTNFLVASVSMDRDSLSLTAGGSIISSCLRQRAIELSRIVTLWDARYITMAHPFLCCMMLPPQYIEVRATPISEVLLYMLMLCRPVC